MCRKRLPKSLATATLNYAQAGNPRSIHNEIVIKKIWQSLAKIIPHPLPFAQRPRHNFPRPSLSKEGYE